MKWIETAYQFPKIDPNAESYFSDADFSNRVDRYHFETLPEFKKLLEERLGGRLSEQERLEIAKTTFRNKPKSEEIPLTPEDRDLADFIYQL